MISRRLDLIALGAVAGARSRDVAKTLSPSSARKAAAASHAVQVLGDGNGFAPASVGNHSDGWLICQP